MLLHAERGVKVRRGFFLARVALGTFQKVLRPGLVPPLIARFLETPMGRHYTEVDAEVMRTVLVDGNRALGKRWRAMSSSPCVPRA